MAPFPYNAIGIIWPTIGITWFITKLAANARTYNSNKWTELLIALRTQSGIFMPIYFWPLDMLLSLTGFGPCQSFRDTLEHDVLDECYRDIASTHGHDAAIFASRDISKCKIRETEKFSDRTRRLPVEIGYEARTACACGATVVTMATTSASAADASPTTKVAPSSLNTYGWVTVVSQQPTTGDERTDLRFARVRVTASPTDWRPGFFAEFDGAQLSQPGQDWIKQYYLVTKVGNTTINIGRMAVSPIWMLPPPFLLETINYPRTPFVPLAYAAQADTEIGSWRIFADISGRSGLQFNDDEQFDRIETSTRIERSFGPSLTMSLTAQASSDFVRESLDFSAKPHEQVDMRGALYLAHENLTGDSIMAQGGYLYVGLRPFKMYKGLEFHGQLDFQKKFGAPANNPLIMSAGVRLLFNKGKQSLTADYQHLPTYDSKPSSGTLLIRAQTRF